MHLPNRRQSSRRPTGLHIPASQPSKALVRDHTSHVDPGRAVRRYPPPAGPIEAYVGNAVAFAGYAVAATEQHAEAVGESDHPTAVENGNPASSVGVGAP